MRDAIPRNPSLPIRTSSRSRICRFSLANRSRWFRKVASVQEVRRRAVMTCILRTETALTLSPNSTSPAEQSRASAGTPSRASCALGREGELCVAAEMQASVRWHHQRRGDQPGISGRYRSGKYRVRTSTAAHDSEATGEGGGGSYHAHGRSILVRSIKC